MEERYQRICERISKIEHSKANMMSDELIDSISFYRRVIKDSLDFINENPNSEFCDYYKNTFIVYYNRLDSLLNSLE